MHAKKKGSVDELAVFGIDIGKETFHLVGFDRAGQLVLRRQIKRLARTAALERFPQCVVGMEACLSAHFVSRTLRGMGFEPRIIPAIYVKLFNKVQKNDYNYADAMQRRRFSPTCARLLRRARISSICKPCIGSGHGWSRGAPQPSTRSERS